MDDPVEPRFIDELGPHFPDFGAAYEPDGLTIDEFDTFAPTRPDAARLHRLVPRPACAQ